MPARETDRSSRPGRAAQPPLRGSRARAGAVLAAAVLAGLVAGAGASQPVARSAAGAVRAAGATRAESCPRRTATPSYAAAVARAVGAKRDVWGEQLLARRGGPTYEAASRFLTPLLYGQQRQRRPLTPSGVYYLPLSLPLSVFGPAVFALHVADGGQIITRHVDGPSLTIRVGRYGRETYGACLARLTPAKLAEGHLPIVQTEYRDAVGGRYRQESFAGRVDGSPSIVSFVRLAVDARRSRTPLTVRFVPSQQGLAARDERLLAKTGTRLIVSPGGAYDGRAFRFRVPAGETAELYALWLHRPSRATALAADSTTYDAMRAIVARFWTGRLDQGAVVSVPEARVANAQRALLVQQIAHTWRYSAGNPYEALSFAEALDTAEVMASYGFGDVARAILRFSLQRLPVRYTAWRAGEQLTATATYYRLYRDRAFVDGQTRGLQRILARLEQGQVRSGPRKGRLPLEQLSSDVQDPIDSVTAQLVVWQGLNAIQPVWRATGHRRLAARARRLSTSLEAAMRKAVRASIVRMADGSLFLPESLGGRARPYDRLSTTSEGSYWNLVVPYALASGFFRPGSREAEGIIRYLLQHGSRMLGVPRADAHIIYGKRPDGTNVPGTAGLGQIYGLSVSRFLADNDRPEQLVLSLYGLLAIGMTPDTYVSGEAVSVVPQRDAYYRKTYMPPNIGANSTFLETLHLALVQERRGRKGEPRGLDLAFATPRAWLASGKQISVDGMRTSFGKLSYTLERQGRTVHARIAPPPRLRSLRLRLRLPAGERVTAVRLNGRPLRFDRSSGTIDLSGHRGVLDVVAAVARAG